MNFGPAFFAAAGGGGGGGGSATFISATDGGLGTVAVGDLVLVFQLNTAGLGGGSPTGWTNLIGTLEGNSYGLSVWYSVYTGSEAAVNTTNFPIGLGYMFTVVYRNVTTVPQVGAKGETSAATSVTAPALASNTGSNSVLIGWSSSRDPAVTQASSESMVQKYHQGYTYFDACVWAQTGVQSGTRTFTRGASTSFNMFAFVLELAP